ncbi:MAG: hypothetical protein M3122_02410 [Actinomycetota bacterium]|nr:hypothetical protein [Actinomycetota bacterium]
MRTLDRFDNVYTVEQAMQKLTGYLKRAMVFGRLRAMKHLQNGVFLVVLFTFFAWSLRVAFVSFDTLSDLTLAGLLNEGLRAVIFVGPVMIYLRYVERAPALEFLGMKRTLSNAAWVLPLTGTLFGAGICCWTALSGTGESTAPLPS